MSNNPPPPVKRRRRRALPDEPEDVVATPPNVTGPLSYDRLVSMIMQRLSALGGGAASAAAAASLGPASAGVSTISQSYPPQVVNSRMSSSLQSQEPEDETAVGLTENENRAVRVQPALHYEPPAYDPNAAKQDDRVVVTASTLALAERARDRRVNAISLAYPLSYGLQVRPDVRSAAEANPGAPVNLQLVAPLYSAGGRISLRYQDPFTLRDDDVSVAGVDTLALKVAAPLAVASADATERGALVLRYQFPLETRDNLLSLRLGSRTPLLVDPSTHDLVFHVGAGLAVSDTNALTVNPKAPLTVGAGADSDPLQLQSSPPVVVGSDGHLTLSLGAASKLDDQGRLTARVSPPLAVDETAPDNSLQLQLGASGALTLDAANALSVEVADPLFVQNPGNALALRTQDPLHVDQGRLTLRQGDGLQVQGNTLTLRLSNPLRISNGALSLHIDSGRALSVSNDGRVGVNADGVLAFGDGRLRLRHLHPLVNSQGALSLSTAPHLQIANGSLALRMAAPVGINSQNEVTLNLASPFAVSSGGALSITAGHGLAVEGAGLTLKLQAQGPLQLNDQGLSLNAADPFSVNDQKQLVLQTDDSYLYVNPASHRLTMRPIGFQHSSHVKIRGMTVFFRLRRLGIMPVHMVLRAGSDQAHPVTKDSAGVGDTFELLISMGKGGTDIRSNTFTLTEMTTSGAVDPNRLRYCLPHSGVYPYAADRLHTDVKGTSFLLSDGSIIPWYVKYNQESPDVTSLKIVFDTSSLAYDQRLDFEPIETTYEGNEWSAVEPPPIR
ncbi:fiber [Guinea pig adenovirus]|nr:fiber [Guinea pig adenovirus]